MCVQKDFLTENFLSLEFSGIPVKICKLNPEFRYIISQNIPINQGRIQNFFEGGGGGIFKNFCIVRKFYGVLGFFSEKSLAN